MRIHALFTAALLAGAAVPAAAQEMHTPVAVTWKQWPDAQQLKPFTPEKAARLGVGGWALVDCLVAEDGRLTDCNAWATSNADLYFTDAANRLTQMRPFAIDLTAAEGDQLAGKAVRFPIIFRVDYPDFKRAQFNAPKAPPAVCFPNDDGSTPIIATPQSGDLSTPIRRC